MSTPASRAVLRPIDPGNDAVCVHCRAAIKFAAREHRRQAIANVYVDGAWDRVEHYHESCYQEAGEPHGAVIGRDHPDEAERQGRPAAGAGQP